MKKILIMLGLVGMLGGCSEFTSPEKMLEKQLNPYREYKMKETELAKKLETKFLEQEGSSRGLDKEKSAVHITSFVRHGDYASGEVRVLGFLTPLGLEMANEKNPYGLKITNESINYNMKFEYSYKTERYVFFSEFPYWQ